MAKRYTRRVPGRLTGHKILDGVFANGEYWVELDFEEGTGTKIWLNKYVEVDGQGKLAQSYVEGNRWLGGRSFVRHPKHPACTGLLEVEVKDGEVALKRTITDDANTPAECIGQVAEYLLACWMELKSGKPGRPTGKGYDWAYEQERQRPRREVYQEWLEIYGQHLGLEDPRDAYNSAMTYRRNKEKQR